MGDTTTESGGNDPDAPWRRGYAGWAQPTSEVDPESTATPTAPSINASDLPSDLPSDRRVAAVASPDAQPEPTDASNGRAGRHRWWLVLAVPGIVVLVVVVMWSTRGGDDATASSFAPSLPESVDAAWTLPFDRVIDDVAIADDVVVVGAAGGVTVFDLADGSEIWSRPELLGGRDIEIDRIALIEDRILVQVASGAGSDVRAFDRATGEALWESDGGGGAYTILDATDRPSVLLRHRVDGRNVGQMIDTVTGDPLGEPVPLSSVSATGRHLGVEPADRQVAAWSTDTQEIVAGPVDSFGLSAIAPVDGALVALDLDSRIAAFDDDGVRTDERPLTPVGGEATVRAELLGVASASTAVVGSETSVGVQSSLASFGFEVEDGDIVVRWQIGGRVSQLVDADWGTAGLLVRPDPNGVAQIAIVDATTGRTVSQPTPGRERLPDLAGNGYLIAPLDGADDRVLEAFTYDDRPMWSLPIAADADYELLDDAVVVVESSLASSMLTVAR